MKSAILRALFPMTLPLKIDRLLKRTAAPARAAAAFTSTYLAKLKEKTW